MQLWQVCCQEDQATVDVVQLRPEQNGQFPEIRQPVEIETLQNGNDIHGIALVESHVPNAPVFETEKRVNGSRRHIQRPGRGDEDVAELPFKELSKNVGLVVDERDVKPEVNAAQSAQVVELEGGVSGGSLVLPVAEEARTGLRADVQGSENGCSPRLHNVPNVPVRVVRSVAVLPHDISGKHGVASGAHHLSNDTHWLRHGLPDH